MRTRNVACVLAAGMVISLGARAQAQSKVPVRQIGKLERVSADSSVGSIASAVALSGGRVMINDRVGHRVLLLDSILANETVVADTNASSGATYGRRPAGLVRFRGDSALLIDQVSLSMFVLGPTGAVARVMALPHAQDALAISATGAIDARGRLVYFDGINGAQGVLMLGVGDPVCGDAPPSSNTAGGGLGALRAWIGNACSNRHVDSMPLIRIDLSTRTVDTIGMLAIPTLDRTLKTDAHRALISIETTYDPLPVVDAWAMTRDGTVAVLRTRDYHIDWLGADGKWTSTPKMPFDWQKVDDARKTQLIDSTVARWQGQNDRIMNGGGRGATGLAPLIAARADPATVSDYFPPINDRPGAVAADAEGNVWIRTTTMVDARPVYDVIDRRGEIVDRVQLPAFRTIAGFGPGVVYMAVQQQIGGKVRLERARIK
jgi:hypothetical protein